MQNPCLIPMARPRRFERLASTFGGLRSIRAELRAHARREVSLRDYSKL